MDTIDPEAFEQQAQVVRRVVAEVEAGRLVVTEFERGYLAGWLATLEGLANGTEERTPRPRHLRAKGGRSIETSFNADA